MADLGEIVVRITGDTSGLDSAIASANGQLSSLGAITDRQASAMSSAFAGTAKQTALLNATVTQTEGSLNKLKTGLSQQEKATKSYTVALRESGVTLRQKQAAVKEAASAYKTNTAAINNNITGLQAQQASITAGINQKTAEIAKLKDANKTLSRSSQAYKDNQKAIKWTEVELKNYQARQKETSTAIRESEKALTAEENAYRNAQAEVKAAAKAQSDIRDSLKQSQAAEKDYSSRIEETSQNLQAQQEAAEKAAKQQQALENAQLWQTSGSNIKQFGEGVDAVTKPLQVASVAVLGLGTASAMAAVSFEDNFAAVKKTVDGTPEQLAEIKQSLIDMTTVGINGHSAIPQTTGELTELAAAGGQLGIATENIADFTETMAMLGSATNLYGEQGAATLARFMNVTNTSQDKISNLGSAIVDLGNNFATTEAEIAQMALNMGATGNVVGISAQDVLAYSTALSSLGVEAQAGGSSVARIWMDIQSAVSSGGKDLQKFAKLSGKSSKEFAQQWKTDASGAFQSFLKGLSESEDQIGTLSDLGFNNIRDIQALQRLAGEKGLGLLTEAIKRSNEAWEENTALQTEFEAKAETTASKMAVAKNNAVEAARSFGEVMLPTIVDVTGGLSSMTQGMAKWDDSTKKAVVSAGAFVVGLGAASKGAAGTIKTVGGMVEGVGKIKGALATGGTLAKIAPTLTAIGSAAAPVAITVAAVGTAALVTKGIYDSWYNSQYRFTAGLNESNEKLKESRSEFQKLSALKQEVNDLRWVIKNPESSKADVDHAKSRLEEIKTLLAEEYNLVINTDNQGLDEAAEKVEKVIEGAKEQSRVERDNAEAELRAKLAAAENKAPDSKQRLADVNKEIEANEHLRDSYTELSTSITKKLTKLTEFEGTSAEKGKKAKKLYYAALGEYEKIYGKEARENVEAGLQITKGYEKRLKALKRYVNDDYESIIEKIGAPGKDGNPSTGLYLDKGNIEGSLAEIKAFHESLANMALEDMQVFAKEGDDNGVSRMLKKISEDVQKGELDLQGYAIAASQAMNGISIEDAWTKGGDDLNNFVNDYTRAMQEFGASAQETAVGASLIRNGFKSIGDAVADGKLDVVVSQANELAHSMGLIPEDKHIVISANGDVSILEDVQAAVENVNSSGNVNIEVSATGDLSVIETADEKLKELINNNSVTVTFNAETNGFDISNLQGEKIGEITAEGKINWSEGETPTEVPPAEGKANYEVGTSPETVPDASGKANFSLGDYPTSIPPITATVNVKQQATGTQNFPGGLAMVNDQKGVADPRELIVDKGRAFIPQGKDVILPLSRGAKVYTAAQTKSIMRGLGIPHYASGKNNSDAFTAAKDDWTHYTKTHAVTTTQELQKWVEFSQKFKDNQKDIWDIQEQIFSLQQKVTAELNKQSLAYIDDRTALNDWEDFGDSAIDAFGRIRDRNKKALDAGRLTWDEYTQNVSSAGTKLYDGRISQSKKWLEHEEKYNGMSSASYIAGIDRMRGYTEEYYAQGIISYREYVESLAELEEWRIDKYKESVAEQFNISKQYISDKTYFNDWGDNGDSPLDAYNRVKERLQNDLANGDLTSDEYKEYMTSLGSDMLSERIQQSKNWLEEQRKYFGLSDEEYAEGIERMKKYTQEYLDLGIIGRREYNEQMTELNHMLWDEAADSYDKALAKQSEYISEMRDKFQKEEQELRDKWTVADRKADMSEVRAQLDVYRNAVTDRGQQKYKELQEQMKQLQRDEELYNLQVKNNAVIEKLEDEYKTLEANKTAVIKNIASINRDVSNFVGNIESNIESSAADMTSLLRDLITAVNNKQFTVKTTEYSDNRKITVNNRKSSDFIGEIALPSLLR